MSSLQVDLEGKWESTNNRVFVIFQNCQVSCESFAFECNLSHISGLEYHTRICKLLFILAVINSS